MGFNAKDRKGGGDFVPIEALEAGNYPARLVQLVNMGIQPQRPYKGVEKKPAEQLYVAYELSHEFMVDENGEPDASKPRWIGEDFTFNGLGAKQAKSTERYHAFDPTEACEGDWERLLGSACTVTLSKVPRKTEGFTNYVTHVSGPSKFPGYTQPELVNPVRIFDLENPDLEVFKELPEWLRTKVATNLEMKGSKLEAMLTEAGLMPEAAPAAPTTPAPIAPAAPAPAMAPPAPVAPPKAPPAPPVPPAPAAENAA